MKFIEHCLHHCVHVEVIEATGFGGIGGAFHMNDLLVLLRTLNKMRPAPQVFVTSSPCKSVVLPDYWWYVCFRPISLQLQYCVTL